MIFRERLGLNCSALIIPYFPSGLIIQYNVMDTEIQSKPHHFCLANPEAEEILDDPFYYLYSSARDYYGNGKGLLAIEFIV